MGDCPLPSALNRAGRSGDRIPGQIDWRWPVRTQMRLPVLISMRFIRLGRFDIGIVYGNFTDNALLDFIWEVNTTILCRVNDRLNIKISTFY